MFTDNLSVTGTTCKLIDFQILQHGANSTLGINKTRKEFSVLITVMVQMLWTAHKCIQIKTFLWGIIFKMLNQISVCLLQAVCHPDGHLLVLYIVCHAGQLCWAFPKSSNLLSSGLYCFRTVVFQWVYPLWGNSI